MSFFARNYVPMGFAIVFGIANGYYAFNTILKEQHGKSEPPPKSAQQAGSASNDTTTKETSP
ncbi:hypothetical protein F5B17DRAFT_391974 [Nemania serpens]|nr:hypothetical protein F5B17DRAFT_391974 [Nemania serpens]